MSVRTRPMPPRSVAPDERGAVADARAERLLEWMLRHPPAARPAPPRGDKRSRTRLVLDTNVSLDLVVFRDPRWTVLAGMLADGSCEAVIDAVCRAEFARVLGYPQFGLAPGQRVRALAAFDALHRVPVGAECRDEPLDGLPQCRDSDDQKFIELAFRARAHALLSKDKALLKLARRNQREGLFAILSPGDWLQSQPAPAPGT